MDELQELLDSLNVVNCDGGDIFGTGQAGCKFDWSRIKTLEFSKIGFKYEGKSLAYIQEQQQKGNLIIAQNVVSFVDATADPNIITREGSGLKVVAGENPYEYNITFDNGVNFWKALRSMNSNGQYALALYDTEGNKIFTQTKSGVVRGFNLAMMQTGKYVGKDGVNASGQVLTLQIADFKDMDRQTWITADELDYSPSDLDGVNDVEITLNPVVAGATTLVFTPLLKDRTHLVEGLLLADFLVQKTTAGVTTTVTATGTAVYNNTDKTVTLTVPAAVAGSIYSVKLWDAALGVPIIVTPNFGLAKSNEASALASA